MASAVVDSGADFCAFPLSVAQDLKLSLASMERASVMGVGGKVSLTYFETVALDLGQDILFQT